MNSTVIKKLNELYEEFDAMARVFNESYVTAKVQETEVDYTNEVGEAVKVSTKILFDEFYHHPMGRNSSAGKRLMELYPELFALEDKIKEKRKEIEEYEVTQFGFKGQEMKLPDLIGLIDSIVQFRLAAPSMDVTE